MRLNPLAILLLLAPGAALAQPAEADAVRAAFADYRGAAASHDGEAAYARVDATTRAYYERIVALARHAPAEEVQRLPFPDQLTILAARLRIPAGALEPMDGQAFFVHAVEQGWVGRDVARAALGPVRVEGDAAYAQGALGGQTFPLELTFRREAEGWKLDLVALTEAMAVPLQQVMQQAGLTPTTLALRLLAGESGEQVPPSVWTPPFPR